MLFKNEVAVVVELLLSFPVIFLIIVDEKFNEFEIVFVVVCGIVKLLVELLIFVKLLVKEDVIGLGLEVWFEKNRVLLNVGF